MRLCNQYNRSYMGRRQCKRGPRNETLIKKKPTKQPRHANKSFCNQEQILPRSTSAVLLACVSIVSDMDIINEIIEADPCDIR